MTTRAPSRRNLDPATRVSEGEAPDEVLMVAYIGGDRSAFARLFTRLAPRVHAFFLRSFREPATADDLLQLTFLKLHRARDSYRVDLPLRPWLFSIAARVRLDEIRRRHRLRETTTEDDWERFEATMTPNESADDDRRARAEQVRAALERLPEAQRVIVHLHRYEGMSFPEIATVLGITPGAVKLRAFRAYERLRVDLAALLDGDGE